MDNSLSKSHFHVEKNKVVTNGLKQLSADQQLRNDWFSLTNEYAYPKPVAVFLLEKLCTMFVKSKQQVN